MRAAICHADRAQRDWAARLLEAGGWDVCASGTAEELLNDCRADVPDVIFVHADVWEERASHIVQELKSDSNLYATGVVLITAGVAVDETLEQLRRGAYDILSEPFTPAELLARAHAATRTKELLVELLRRDEHIEELIFVDELSGLFNRRYVLRQLSAAVAAARRHDHALSVVLLDIDRFKDINDTQGHAVGDEVIREVSVRLRERLRTEDVAGRLGGDEFLVVLPETELGGARRVAEALRQSVIRRKVDTARGPLRVTMSIGCATWGPGQSSAELLETADQALYAAKSAGRDRVAAA